MSGQIRHLDHLAQAAADYAARGWRVIPLHSIGDNGRCTCGKTDCGSPGKHPRTRSGLKDASVDPAQVAAWWRTWPTANVGLVTGADSGLVVVDVDPRHGGDESLAALIAEEGELPVTIEAGTGGGGRHLVFAHPSETIRNKANMRPGLDVRGDGGYIVAPPSNHASGRQYTWADGRGPGEVALADLPTWLLAMLREPARETSTTPPATRPVPSNGQHDRLLQRATAYVSKASAVAEGGRNAAAFNLAGNLAAFDEEGTRLDDGQVFDLVRLWNQRNAPPLAEVELRQVVASASKNGTPRPVHAATTRPVIRGPMPAVPDADGSLPLRPRTDAGNAECFADLYADQVRFVHGHDRWRIWTGTHWADDVTGEADRLALATVRHRLTVAATLADDAQRAEEVKWAIKSEATGKRRDLLTSAQSVITLATTPDAFDRNPMQLNVANGILDLASGDLLPHDPAAMHSKLVPVDYLPEATCPRWQRFLTEVFGGDLELVAFLQRAIGYSLTADTSEECLFLLHGTGANGKSTLIAVLQALLGDYSEQAGFQTFCIDRDRQPIRNDLAKLHGRRLVVASETSEGIRLSEATVKALTGRDRITARYLYAEEFTFEPVAKFWLAVNHRPRVRDTSLGFWRRIRLVPFEQSFANRPDKDLRAKLLDELPGILSWAVQGCIAWQALRDLRPPERVSAATAEYQTGEDILGGFLSECTITGGHLHATAADLYQRYTKWCESGGERAMTQTRFGRELGDRGFAKIRGAGRRFEYVGIAIEATTVFDYENADPV